MPVCNKIEAEIAELDEADKMEFLETLGMEEAGLNRVIRAGYQLLNLQTYFTAGVKEVRAWTVRVGATAPQAAAVIHTDFEKGFIRAEVIAYDDFIQYKGEAGAKEAGKWRLEGKDYIVKDGDVMHFRFNVLPSISTPSPLPPPRPYKVSLPPPPPYRSPSPYAFLPARTSAEDPVGWLRFRWRQGRVRGPPPLPSRARGSAKAGQAGHQSRSESAA